MVSETNFFPHTKMKKKQSSHFEQIKKPSFWKIKKKNGKGKVELKEKKLL